MTLIMRICDNGWSDENGDGILEKPTAAGTITLQASILVNEENSVRKQINSIFPKSDADIRQFFRQLFLQTAVCQECHALSHSRPRRFQPIYRRLDALRGKSPEQAL